MPLISPLMPIPQWLVKTKNRKHAGVVGGPCPGVSALMVAGFSMPRDYNDFPSVL